jgi:hypothetical protein
VSFNEHELQQTRQRNTDIEEQDIRIGFDIESKPSTSYTDIEGAFIDIVKSSISGYNDIEVLNFDIDIFFDIGI